MSIVLSISVLNMSYNLGFIFSINVRFYCRWRPTTSSKPFSINPNCQIKSWEVRRNKCIVLLNKYFFAMWKSTFFYAHFPLKFSNLPPDRNCWVLNIFYVLCGTEYIRHWFILVKYRILVRYHCVFVYRTHVRIPATLAEYRRHHQLWKNSQNSNKRLIYISDAHGVMKVNDCLYFLHIYLLYLSTGFQVNLI